jgi:transposase
MRVYAELLQLNSFKRRTLLNDNLQSRPAPQPWLAELVLPISKPRRRGEAKPHADFLNLPNVICDADKPIPREWVIYVEAEQTEVPTYPDCDCAVKEVKPHGTFPMKEIHDLPWGRKCVIFRLKRRRWMCKTCKETVTQPADFLAETRYGMTQRLLEYLQVHSLFETEHSLFKETGVFVRKIREIREEFVERLKKKVRFDDPCVLGMDGVRADAKRRRVIITDIKGGRVLDFMESGSAKSIADRLQEFPWHEDVQIVAIDMCKTLRAATKEALPQAIIIIDLFHVMRIANQVMDAVRVRLFPWEKKKREPGQPGRPRPETFRKRRASLTECDRKYMEYWFELEPELRMAYDLKEKFMELFDDEFYAGGVRLRSKESAHHFYEEWLKDFPLKKEYPKLHKNFNKIFSAINNWGDYIFNYFDFKVTNAFTESMNRKVKDILRNSRGCKFETMKARIIYGTYLMKKRDEDRKAELEALFPHFGKRRRGRTLAPVGGNVGKANGAAREGQFQAYELPEVIQMALDFTN